MWSNTGISKFILTEMEEKNTLKAVVLHMVLIEQQMNL